jgi:hypothetical protein
MAGVHPAAGTAGNGGGETRNHRADDRRVNSMSTGWFNPQAHLTFLDGESSETRSYDALERSNE